MITLALALRLLQGAPHDTTAARAEAFLASGNVNAALALATTIVERHPRDPAAHMLLGRVQYARPIIGRYPALDEFRTAARLAPNDPEPWYWQMKVGFYLRSDDGEWIAREALIGLFAVDPDYKDAWARFRDVFHNDGICRRAERALARHGDKPAALEHRAEMLNALDQPQAAESLLARAAALRGPTLRSDLLRAEAAFRAGHADAGYAWHDSALALADVDSGDVLWDEAWLIASPDEIARHAALAPGERRAFYERFWGERDPDLLTVQNERVEEHYARMSESRRMYRLLHPQRSWYHSAIARSLTWADDRHATADAVDTSALWLPGQSTERLLIASGAGFGGERSLQDTSAKMAFHAGLSAAGLVFVRQGAPDDRGFCISDVLRGIHVIRDTLCSNYIDEDSWVYYTPEGPLSIRFTGGAGEYFRPISAEQTRSAHILIRTDRTSLPAPLKARAWAAMFASHELGQTDAYYKANGDSSALALWSDDGVQRVGGTGLLHLTVAPGQYDLGLDVDSAGQLGRLRRAIRVPYFSHATVGLSSLVLAPLQPRSPLPDREATLRAMPADLHYPAGAPLAAYAEVYGLALGPDNRSRYHVRYTFAPLRSTLARFLGAGGRPVVFEFDRVVPFSTASEQLAIEPGKLAPGRYRVTVAVTDVTRNVKSESVALDIVIR